jgi:cytochrome c-type biogenesis protein CcmE
VLVGTLALGTAILAAVFGLTKPTVTYARTVSDFAERPLRETPVRVTGYLVRGSLCKVPSKCEYRFRLTDEPPTSHAPRSELEIRYEHCEIPDTFRDVPGLDFEISVEGTLCDDCRHLDASHVIAKCPSKYEIRFDAGAYQSLGRPVRSCASNAEANPHSRF